MSRALLRAGFMPLLGSIIHKLLMCIAECTSNLACKLDHDPKYRDVVQSRVQQP
jgi:hypothetical protein